MTPELEKEVVSLIGAAKQAGTDAASFITQHAPDVIQQMLVWETAKAIVVTLILVGLAGAFIYCGRRLKRLNNTRDYPDPWVAYVAAGLLGLFAIGSTMKVVKIQIAPNIVIMEEIADLARGR